ncbi:MAG: hypothetical protein JWO50_529 [Candidatus Kaiserbacteria bacterium]|nr:hypothetical protein [Candidatus Kaiserbacteria bacterium]
MINAEVQKSGGENVLATIRKFTRRVQGTNLIKDMRAIRYHARLRSKSVVKKSALKLLKRKADYRQLIKEGKVIERVRRPMQKDQKPQGTTSQSRFGETTPIAR